MRHLFLTQGLPASGKSSFIRDHNLSKHTLSYDKMREMFSISAHDLHGDDVMSIRRGVQTQLVNATHSAADYRMSNGDTLFVDNTNTSRNAIKPWLHLARKYDYKVHVLSFGHSESVETFIERDLNRHGRSHVGEATIRRMHGQLQEYVPHPEATHVYEDHWDYVKNILNVPETDVSQYDEIIIVGDVQGCGNALEKMLNKFGGFEDKSKLWIFVGDLYDRGPTPEKVFDLTWPNPSNVIVVQGNHERSVRHTLMGVREFKQSRETTIDRIPENKHKSLLKQVQRSTPIVWFHWNGQKVIVTHAGIAGSIAHQETTHENLLGLRSDYEYYIGASDRGNAYFNTGTYENFMEGIQHPLVMQFFGHRNDYDTVHEPSTKFPNLFPLENKVEHGGNLVAAHLTSDNSVKYHSTQE